MRSKIVSSLVVAFSLGVVQAASAADMPVKARAVPVAAYNWTGCYVGVNGGLGWGNARWKDPGLGDFEFSNHNISGGLAGGTFGCNYQTGSVVLGLEGDVDWADIHGSSLDTLSAGALTDNTKIDFMATAAGRIGWAWGPALIYAKGGAAWVHDKYWAIVNATGATFYSAAQTRTGWMVGAGVEYAFSGPWSAKIEYNYIDLGTKAATFAGGTFPGAPFPFNIKEQVSVVKLGLNYRFY
jgi:outer membrane immunogenic protein